MAAIAQPLNGRNIVVAPQRLGTKETSVYLGGISEDTLRYWRYSGTGPRSYRLGRRTYYDIVDLDDWVTEQKELTSVGGVKVG